MRDAAEPEEGFEGDFYEDDEPLEKIQAAWDAGRKVTTARPDPAPTNRSAMQESHHWWADCLNCEISVVVKGSGQRLVDPSDDELESPLWALDCPYCGSGLSGWNEGGSWRERAGTVPADAVFDH